MIIQDFTLELIEVTVLIDIHEMFKVFSVAPVFFPNIIKIILKIRFGPIPTVLNRDAQALEILNTTRAMITC